jgi:hypothetical protein
MEFDRREKIRMTLRETAEQEASRISRRRGAQDVLRTQDGEMNEPVNEIHRAICVEEPICYRRILKVLIQGKHVDTKNQQVHPHLLINRFP